jgi:hypothetical protein
MKKILIPFFLNNIKKDDNHKKIISLFLKYFQKSFLYFLAKDCIKFETVRLYNLPIGNCLLST